MIATEFTNAQGLSRHEFDLYGRQILLPQIGVEGQNNLRNSKVVLIGAGGLGSPAALYVATSGIGHLKVVDGDTVSLSNLHRQVIHGLNKLGQNKATSAAEECMQRNDTIVIESVPFFITSSNAENIINGATVVLDASDNARTRYLVNDICCILGVPLVSGSALGWEGQLSVYGYNGGPCYRCVYPIPPSANNAGACELQGVIGPAPGIIGVMQAAEAIKICLKLEPSVLSGRLLLLDCLSRDRMWRSITLRNKITDCITCKNNAVTRPKDIFESCPDEIYPQLPPSQTIEPIAFYNKMIEIVKDDTTPTKNIVRIRKNPGERNSIVIDVRKPMHFSCLHIEGTIHFEIENLLNHIKLVKEAPNETIKKQALDQLFITFGIKNTEKTNLYVLCRRGRDASKATCALNALLMSETINCMSVIGGLQKLVQDIPELTNFPFL